MLKKISVLLMILFEMSESYVVFSAPPEPNDVARMARYIIHESDWVSIATISTQKAIKSYPFVTLKSLSDGPEDNSTGVPYLYMTKMDVSGQDVDVDNRVTIMASLAESDYCKSENFDPQDPRCAKVIITGKLVKVDTSSAEYNFAKNALYQRHPSMKYWPIDHGFYVAKINIEQIDVLDFFGGLKHVTQKDYFNVNLTDTFDPSNKFLNISIIDITVL